MQALIILIRLTWHRYTIITHMGWWFYILHFSFLFSSILKHRHSGVKCQTSASLKYCDYHEEKAQEKRHVGTSDIYTYYWVYVLEGYLLLTSIVQIILKVAVALFHSNAVLDRDRYPCVSERWLREEQGWLQTQVKRNYSLIWWQQLSPAKEERT